MAGQRHLPLIVRQGPDSNKPSFLRGRISPCTGCQNQTSVSADPKSDVQSETKNWPCPKSILYAHKAWAKGDSTNTTNFDHPVYDDKLRGINPIPAGVTGHQNGYSYVYVATYEDNVENGWNPGFDTQRIRCRGPFLISTPERLMNCLGRLEQGDHVLVFSRYYFLDGAQFEGFVIEAATWQVHSSATRKIDTNLVSTLSGAR